MTLLTKARRATKANVGLAAGLLLLAAPLAAGTGTAAVLDGLVTTTTTAVTAPAPVGTTVTTVVSTVEQQTGITSPVATTVPVPVTPVTPTAPAQPAPTTTTTAPPSPQSSPGAGAAKPAPATAPSGTKAGPPAPAAPAPAPSAAANVGDTAAALPAPAAAEAPATPAGLTPAPPEVVIRDLTSQFAQSGYGFGPRSTETRSTAALFDRLQALRLTPAEVARMLAPFPVAGSATYSDDWGAPRTGPHGALRTHEGVDIFAERGTPVIASASGVVSRLATGTAIGGTSLRLTAADGTYYYYAHLDRFAPGLAANDHVTKGAVLGFVGNTGDAASTPPHLHFEIHPRGGSAVPPVPYLDRWLAEADESIGTVEAAPASSRTNALRSELAKRAAAPDGVVGAGAGSADLGPLAAISTRTGFGITGILLVLAVAGGFGYREARRRLRQAREDTATAAQVWVLPERHPDPQGAA